MTLCETKNIVCPDICNASSIYFSICNQLRLYELPKPCSRCTGIVIVVRSHYLASSSLYFDLCAQSTVATSTSTSKGTVKRLLKSVIS